MVKLECLGGGREVGGNAFLIKGKKNIMLDYGMHIEDGRMPLATKSKIDAVFVTHGHLDHLGALPILQRQSKCPVYWTAPTRDNSDLLLHDSIKVAEINQRPLLFNKKDIVNVQRAGKLIDYGDIIRFDKDLKATIWDAGHIPGSYMTTIQAGKTKILYTGDFFTQKTALLNGANFDNDADVLLLETTYSSREHPSRAEESQKFFSAVQDTINKGGIAVLPTFALRAAELLVILNQFKADFPIYLDGMARTATEIITNHPQFVRNPKSLEAAYASAEALYSTDERNKALKQPCAIITTSGAMEGGPVMHYMKRLYSRSDCSLIFTGFQIPGTAARYLADTGRFVANGMDFKVKMNIHRFDFSGHAGRSDLLKFVKKVQPRKVVCIHGDYAPKFATELQSRFDLDAVAPKNGEIIDL